LRIPHEASGPLGKEFIELTPDVTAAILTTLIDGWQSASSFADVNAQAGEVAITERLRDGMRLRLKTNNHPWGKMLMVLPGTESRSNDAVLLPDGRTDIPLVLIEVFLRTQEHDPHAIIECKRIAGSDAHLCREYVVEGMDRFSTGKYGQNHAVGFMVGYLLSGSSADAVAAINGYLSRATRIPDQLHPATIAVNIPGWVSQHVRSSPLPPIYLHHSFFGLSAAA
jgi:hypothetical protein